MARPAFWKGYLKLSLVTCPVTMTPATTEAEKVRFHTLNRASGKRVRSQYVDSETGKAVADDDQAKGYESSEGQFVTFTDDELEAVQLESVRTIDIDNFVPADTIPWIYYDSPYYMMPSDKVGEEAFAVIRDAMAEKGVVGISRVVMFRRERAVMLEPRDGGIILWTLRYGDEVRDAEAYFADIDDEKTDPKLIKMIKELIDDRSEPWDRKMVTDPVQDKLKEIIAAKKAKGAKAKPKKTTEPDGAEASNVVNLMDALKVSLERSQKKPAKK